MQLYAELLPFRALHLHRMALLYQLDLNRRCRLGPRHLDRKLYPINALQLDDPRLTDEEFNDRLRPFLVAHINRFTREVEKRRVLNPV